MNSEIKELVAQCTHTTTTYANGIDESEEVFDKEKFVGLLVDHLVHELAKLNKQLSYELQGVIIDVESGPGFDRVCLNTIKRVAAALSNAQVLEKHFLKD